MNEKRLGIKVGAFSIVALVVLAAILLVFSKGEGWFVSAYTLRLRADNVGGLKARSSVLISGVPVGTVTGAELSPDDKGVTIFLKIQKRYGIHRDALFNVEQIRENLSATLANLNTLSSNRARYGLLHKPKPPKPTQDSRPFYPGYSPFK